MARSPRLEVPITALAWGVLLAGILQLLFQLPFLYREGLLPRPKWGWQHEGVQKIIKLMIPALFGSSVAQINLLFDTFIASFLVSGSVAWLYYADRLLEFPLGVFGIALATVVLPNLSQAHYKAGDDSFNHTLHWALQLTLIIALPATIGLFLLAQPILATLFEYGAFNDQRLADVRLQPDGLQPRPAGLHPDQDPGERILRAPGHQNAGAHRHPGDVPQHGPERSVRGVDVKRGIIAPHVGLALATTASAYYNAFRLARELRRDRTARAGRQFLHRIAQDPVRLRVMGLLIYFSCCRNSICGANGTGISA